MGDTRFEVRKYISWGWSVIPIPRGEKGPRVPNWQKTVFAEEAFGPDDNIGVRLGDVSGHLVDVDLDCQCAVALAPSFLPDTGLIFGRPGKPQSHYFYIVDDVKPFVYKNIDGSTLLEVRSNGQQTVLPPSMHPSGEQLFFAHERTANKLENAGFADGHKMLATSVLVAMHWPPNGATTPQHDLAGYIAGFLAARGLSPKAVEVIIERAATWAKDDNVKDRARVARETVERFGDGSKPIAGGPKIAEILGEPFLKRLSEWYGGNKAQQDGLVDEMNARHFAVRVGKDTVYGQEEEDELILQPAKALFEWYVNQKIVIGEKVIQRGDRKGQTEKAEKSKFEVWREHPRRRSYRTVTFAPPPRQPHKDDYNLWKGLAIEPVPGDCSLFLDHCKTILCSGNEEHYEYLLDLLAFTVQQPGTPSEIAVVLKGELGTGKGIFIRNFGALFGRHFVQLDRSEHLTGKFNSAISGKVVVFADEAFFAGDKRDLGSMKRLISEPTLQIERKGIDSTREANCIHLFMATNEEWAFQAAMKERRFFCLHVSSDRIQDHAYFEAVQQECEQGGLSALLALLLARPVTHARVRNVPRTNELRIQQEHTLAPELKWWKGCLEKGGLDPDGEWPAEVNIEHLFESYIRWCDVQKINRRITDIDMSRRALKPWFIGEPRRNKVDGRRVWVRSLVPIGQAREIFDSIAGTTSEWEGTEVDGPKTNGSGPKDLPF